MPNLPETQTAQTKSPLVRRMQTIAHYIRKSEFVAYHWRTGSLLLMLLVVLFATGLFIKQPSQIISPILTTLSPLQPLKESKKGYEVFGFAPYWTINKLDNVDYKTLTTLAYFGMEIDENGDIIQDDPGYITFNGKKATEVFKKSSPVRNPSRTDSYTDA